MAAIVANSIETFQFIDLAGNPDPVKARLAVGFRPGVDGITLVNDGKRGRPFTLRSKVDCADVQSGRQLYAEYTKLIDGRGGTIGNHDVVWQGVDLFQEYGTQFAVLDVTVAMLRKISGASGGLNPPSGAWLECDWTLLAMYPPARPAAAP